MTAESAVHNGRKVDIPAIAKSEILPNRNITPSDHTRVTLILLVWHNGLPPRQSSTLVRME